VDKSLEPYASAPSKVDLSVYTSKSERLHVDKSGWAGFDVTHGRRARL